MRTIQRDIAGALLFSNDGRVLIGKNVKGGVYEDLWVAPGGGIDISDATIESVNLPQTCTAEKTFRDTGERVLVLYPLVMFAFSWLYGVLAAFIFNIVVGVSGGVELTTKTTPTQK